jgi:alkylhydroperoxidase family enzyme
MANSGQARTPAEVAAREAYITGRPARVVALAPDEISPEAHEISAEMLRAAGAPVLPEVPDFVAIMLRHKRLARAHLALANEFFRTELTYRDREIVILRTGWLCQAPYEWGSHVVRGKSAGLSSAEIERITEGSQAAGWDEHDRALLRAVEELFENAMISDETWEVLRRDLNDEQLIELPLLVGQYQGVAYIQNSFRVRLMQENPGLTAR